MTKIKKTKKKPAAKRNATKRKSPPKAAKKTAIPKVKLSLAPIPEALEDHFSATAGAHSEIILGEVLSELKNHKDFLSIAGTAVGMYWDKKASRAPFEEELTLRQLTSLDIHNFLRKKSMTSARIDAIVGAAQNALRTLNSIKPEEEEQIMLPVRQKPALRKAAKSSKR